MKTKMNIVSYKRRLNFIYLSVWVYVYNVPE